MDEEADIPRAIELSLQDATPSPGSQNQTAGKNADYIKAEVIDDDSDGDVLRNTKLFGPDPASDISSDSSVVSKSFLGLDRKAMEQERLDRKRNASISPPSLRKSVKISTGESALDVHPAVKMEDCARSSKIPGLKFETGMKVEPGSEVQQRLKIEKGKKVEAALNIEEGFLEPGLIPTSASEPTFLDAAVKKTWAHGYNRHEDITIEEVFQRSDLTLAVISSFQWDIDWLYSKLDSKSTRLTLIMEAKEDSLKRQYEEETSSMPNLRLCFPPMEGPVGCMHSKLMLLGHPSYLRIVVTTANLVPYDWGETGVMENMVFLIDLPRLPATHAEKPLNQMTSFEIELINFLEAMGLDEKIVQSIHQFDFSRTKDLAFVHSIGGVHVGPDGPWRRTGFCGLGMAIQELGLANQDGSTVAVDYVSSSMGTMGMGFLQTFYMAAQGDVGLTEYCWRRVDFRDWMRTKTDQNLRVYYPLQETVATSKGGTASGGTICFNGGWSWLSPMVQSIFRDCRSQRKGLLMHNKVDPLPCPAAFLLVLPAAFFSMIFKLQFICCFSSSDIFL